MAKKKIIVLAELVVVLAGLVTLMAMLLPKGARATTTVLVAIPCASETNLRRW